jgi:hypothetical protein
MSRTLTVTATAAPAEAPKPLIDACLIDALFARGALFATDSSILTLQRPCASPFRQIRCLDPLP